MQTVREAKTAVYYSLATGEKKGRLQVLNIDLAAKTVRIRQSGMETVMSFGSTVRGSSMPGG
jgi:hypothetical protein